MQQSPVATDKYQVALDLKVEISLDTSQLKNILPLGVRKARYALFALIMGFALALVAWYFNFFQIAAGDITAVGPAKNRLASTEISKISVGERSPDQNHSAPSTIAKSASQAKSAEADSLVAEIFRGREPEVCGLSKAESKEFVVSRQASITPPINRVLAENITKSIQSSELREKTLGLYLLAHQAGQAAMEAERLNYPGCSTGPECFDKPYEAKLQTRPVNAEPLVNLATATRNLDTYAAALYACAGAKTSACNSITFLRWAEMEPDNAAAWLMAASEAEARKDAVARTALLQRAAAANNYDTRAPSMSAFFTTEAVQALPPLAQSAIATTLLEIDGGIRFKPLSGVGRHCGGAESIDDERRALCDVLSTKLADKDQTLAGLRMATAIGERIGWNNDQLKSLKDEYAKGMASTQGEMDGTMFTCDVLVKTNQRARRALTIGERAAARELTKRGGESFRLSTN